MYYNTFTFSVFPHYKNVFKDLFEFCYFNCEVYPKINQVFSKTNLLLYLMRFFSFKIVPITVDTTFLVFFLSSYGMCSYLLCFNTQSTGSINAFVVRAGSVKLENNNSEKFFI